MATESILNSDHLHLKAQRATDTELMNEQKSTITTGKKNQRSFTQQSTTECLVDTGDTTVNKIILTLKSLQSNWGKREN